jgi:hypothetical protein
MFPSNSKSMFIFLLRKRIPWNSWLVPQTLWFFPWRKINVHSISEMPATPKKHFSFVIDTADTFSKKALRLSVAGNKTSVPESEPHKIVIFLNFALYKPRHRRRVLVFESVKIRLEEELKEMPTFWRYQFSCLSLLKHWDSIRRRVGGDVNAVEISILVP